jgi:hypothetical protein
MAIASGQSESMDCERISLSALFQGLIEAYVAEYPPEWRRQPSIDTIRIIFSHAIRDLPDKYRALLAELLDRLLTTREWTLVESLFVVERRVGQDTLTTIPSDVTRLFEHLY